MRQKAEDRKSKRLGKDKYFTDHEVTQLLDYVREHFPKWHLFILCGLRTGLRIGELLGLQWNRELLPPFLTQFRNADGVFSTLLDYCEDANLYGNLSFGILHDSERSSSYADPLLFAVRTRMSDTVSRLVRQMKTAQPHVSAPSRLRAVAEYFGALSRVDVHEFRSVLSESWLAEVPELTTMSQKWRTRESDPFRVAMARYCDRLAKCVDAADVLWPLEFKEATGEGAADGVQDYLGKFADFMRVWPTLWNAAQADRLKRSAG